MLRKFLQRHGWWAVVYSAGMTLLIGFRPWSPEGPLLTSPLQWVVTFVALVLSQLGIRALVDPEVSAKLGEKLEHWQARLKSLQARHEARDKASRELLEREHEEAIRRLKEAWRELKGGRTTKP